jgi:tetratricopeptide (TPR) repeat protein
MEHHLWGENRYCSYNVGLKRTRAIVAARDDVKELMADALRYVEDREYQIAAIVLERVLAIEPTHLEALKYHGFISFLLRNLQQAEASNRKALQVSPRDVYSLKGLGITLYTRGEKEAGIGYLKQAVSLTDSQFMDPYFDLAMVYLDNHDAEEAKALLNQARKTSPTFYSQNQALYEKVFAS